MNRENNLELEEGIVPQDFADAYEKERALLLELEFEQALEEAKSSHSKRSFRTKKIEKRTRTRSTCPFGSFRTK